MKSKAHRSNMIFHALVIGCNHLNVKKLEEIAQYYNYHLSFSSLVNSLSTMKFFPIFLISQRYKNYEQIITNIKLEFPNTLCVILVEDLTAMDEVMATKELFFILNATNSEMSEYFFHQLWHWLSILGAKKYSLDNNNTRTNIAGGTLSLIEETYCKYDKTYTLTRKQLAILKVLLEYRGENVSRTILLDRIWTAEDKVVTDRVIDTNIVALRKMFDDDGRNPKYLQTIFGQGYRLMLD